jgi:hypothetical protein
VCVYIYIHILFIYIYIFIYISRLPHLLFLCVTRYIFNIYTRSLTRYQRINNRYVVSLLSQLSRRFRATTRRVVAQLGVRDSRIKNRGKENEARSAFDGLFEIWTASNSAFSVFDRPLTRPRCVLGCFSKNLARVRF